MRCQNQSIVTMFVQFSGETPTSRVSIQYRLLLLVHQDRQNVVHASMTLAIISLRFIPEACVHGHFTFPKRLDCFKYFRAFHIAALRDTVVTCLIHDDLLDRFKGIEVNSCGD